MQNPPPHFTGYTCTCCGRQFAPDDVTYTCPDDGGNLDVQLDLDAIRHQTTPAAISTGRDPSIWRYAPLLPVGTPPPNSGPLAGVGGTPLYHAERLARQLGLKRLWIKDDGRLPTASFKDRASAVVVVRALEQGIERIVTASSGNAGVALAAMAAAAGLTATIMVPASAPPAKIAQLLIFGAELLLVEGTYDDAVDLALQAAATFGWYCRNTGYNPFTIEGKQTAAFEICEQLGWRAPDRIFVPVGDGNIIAGIHKGFKLLHALGWIEHIPKIMGIQAEGSAAIANAFAAGVETITPVQASTLADSISVGMPSDGLRALRAATQTGGAYLTVTDDEILAAIAELARQTAVFAEPAAATAYAGLLKTVRNGQIAPHEEVAVLITGNGLKDTAAAMRAAGEAPRIEPTLAALKNTLQI